MNNNNISLFNFEKEYSNVDKELFINRDLFIKRLTDLEKIEENNKLKFEIHKISEIISNPECV